MFKALKVEIKNTLFATWFHFVRFGGLLLVPLLYGFSYIFAFWDPFQNVTELPVKTVSHVDENGNEDIFGKALGEALTHEHTAEIGELSLTLDADHIYANIADSSATGAQSVNSDKVQTLVDDQLEDVNVAIVVPPLTHEMDQIIQSFVAANGDALHQALAVSELVQTLTTGSNKIIIYNNAKSNYLTAFGLDIATDMAGTKRLELQLVQEALASDIYRNHVISSLGVDAATYDAFLAHADKILESFENNDFALVQRHTQMHEHSKYGFGLAPFFISVAMWVGGMVLTFAIHRKVYDTTISPVKRYLAKLIMLLSGNVVQAVVLLTALWFVGFDAIGFEAWFRLLIAAILCGWVFSSIIMAIRFMIPSRMLGIMIIIILLVSQMASAGGLFPIETQSGFWQGINKFVPFGHSVIIFREMIYEPRWDEVAKHAIYLGVIPLFMIPIGMFIDYHVTMIFYAKNDIEYISWRQRRKLQQIENQQKGGE